MTIPTLITTLRELSSDNRRLAHNMETTHDHYFCGRAEALEFLAGQIESGELVIESDHALDDAASEAQRRSRV